MGQFIPMRRCEAQPGEPIQEAASPRRAGAFVLSLDFELMWGIRPGRACQSATVIGARAAIPRLLALFEGRGIACTWATVGLLFFDDRAEMERALPQARPRYRNAALSSYGYLGEVGQTEASDPQHFARSLIRRIHATPRQEIGTHTFGHYYWLDAEPNPAAFEADLAAALAAAAHLGLVLESLVMPRNQVGEGALRLAARQGIATVRGAAPGWFNAPCRSRDDGRLRRAARLLDSYLPLAGSGAVEPRLTCGLVNVPASRFLRPVSRRLAPLEPLRAARILRGMRAAARTGRLYHLWFHPHNFAADLELNLRFLDRILAEATRLDAQYGWPSLTMGEVGRRLRAERAA